MFDQFRMVLVVLQEGMTISNSLQEENSDESRPTGLRQDEEEEEENVEEDM